jgi:hypothetical protein
MRRFVVVAIVAGWAGQAHAWNPNGHRVVAAVAYARLQPRVQQKVAALLALNPEYPRWVAGVPRGERDQAAFLRASNWADDIRTLPGYSDDPQPARLGYADKHQHKDWHYINVPFSTDGTRTRPAAVPNVQTQIAALRGDLANGDLPAVERSYALVWLLHLVGDVHMPLHCTARFDRLLPQGDRGGTLILLSADPKDHLHGFWDRALGEDTDLRSAIAAARALPAAPEALVEIGEDAVWVIEGFELAKRWVYRPPVLAGPGPFTLDAAYARDARAVSAKQIALAGARLARVLNDVLK